MRYCRRSLAGIPHQRAGHPRVTHPSATRSPSSCEEKKLVRLACVRHAASVYPEPGSNSPSVFYDSTCLRRWACPRYLSRDPGQAVAVLVTVTFALGCSQILACAPSPEHTSLILDRNCCGRLRVSPVAVLLSTLQLSRYYRKQVLLASLSPSRDR